MADCLVSSTNQKLEDEVIESGQESSDLSNTEENSAISYEIYDLLSDDVKLIFDSIYNKKIGEIYEELKLIYDHIEKCYSGELASEVADMAVLSLLNKNNLVNNDINNIILGKIYIYKLRMKEKYTTEEYSLMDSVSKKFSEKFNNSGYCTPETVVFIRSSKKLDESPIKYNQKIFISLKDFVNIVDIPEEPSYMKNNSNTIVMSMKDNQHLEIEPGSNKIYLDDEQYTMESKVFKPFGSTDYVPAEMLEFAGMKIIEADDSVLVY